MNILMIVKRLRYGGAYKMFLWVAEQLAARGHQITILTYVNGENVQLPSNVKWLRHEEWEKKSTLYKVLQTRKIVKQLQPEVAVSFLLDANIITILACLGLKTKSIFCERNDPFKPHYYKLKLLKPIFRFADATVYQLAKVADYYNNFKGPSAVIPNPVKCDVSGIELKPFAQRADEIVCIGRLDFFQKRLDVLVEAFEKFVKLYPDFKLSFYGDGPDHGRLQAMIAQKGLADNVFLRGITNTPLQLLAESKFFVLTSDFEGIPNSLIEAMSVGLPVISTDCRPGGAALLIEHGVNGYLVPQGDAAAICNYMKAFMDNGAKADQMGQEAKKIQERFNEKRIADMWNTFVVKVGGM